MISIASSRISWWPKSINGAVILKFESVNYDLIYGLPYQTRETFKKTVDLVVGLKPDRIALYSFAYVPWLSKPQNKFNLEAIALHDEKLDIFIQSRDRSAGAWLSGHCHGPFCLDNGWDG